MSSPRYAEEDRTLLPGMARHADSDPPPETRFGGQQLSPTISAKDKAGILQRTRSLGGTDTGLHGQARQRKSPIAVTNAQTHLRLYVKTAGMLKTDLEDMRAMIGHTWTDHAGAGTFVEEKAPSCLILPSSRLSKGADVMQVILLLYVSFTVPLRFGFNLELTVGEPMWWWELFVDLYFICVSASSASRDRRLLPCMHILEAPSQLPPSCTVCC